MSTPMKVTVLLTAVLLLSVLALLPTATYADPGQWIKYSGNPVLSPTSNSWDADYTVSPRVLYDGKIFRMWYNGGNRSGTTGIGYATSTDGFTWSKQPGRVLTPGPPGAWDSAMVALGSVVWNGTIFLMWYRGINVTTFDSGAVGLAMSKDGISWTRYSANPVVRTGVTDEAYLASPYVIKMELTYNMWYTGRNASYAKSSPSTTIFYATSYDGVHWNKWPSAVFSPSADPSAWDSGAVFSPSMFYNGSTFGMWYSGLNQSLVTQVGFATSPDGATWTRSSRNPVLWPGAPGTWDSAGVEEASVILGRNGYMLYYDGFSKNSGGRIGLAQARQAFPGSTMIFTVPEFPLPYLHLLLVLALCATICFLRQQKQPG